MIYFDNAATTMQKPDTVKSAVANAIDSFGGASRGSHAAALDASLAIFRARQKLADFFGAKSPSDIAFTHNATEALNIAISGLVKPKMTVVTTQASHNSVLRPLYRLEQNAGVNLNIAKHKSDGNLDYDDFAQKAIGADVAVVTHASNVTGQVFDIERIARICKQGNQGMQGKQAAPGNQGDCLLIVDAAQTAGIIDINVLESGIDVLAFTGHKSLYGPQGTGGLAVSEGVEIPPYNVGGSGIHSYDKIHPCKMPESLEAGTLNAHGIAGLLAGVEYIENYGLSSKVQHLNALANAFIDGIRDIPGVEVYGIDTAQQNTGIVAFNIKDCDSSQVADILDREFHICTRAGAHCAPLMHEALGTSKTGIVRFSFGIFNTMKEVDIAVSAISEIAKACPGEK